MRMYSIYDKKTRMYAFPTPQHNDDSAKRWFTYVLSKSEMVADDLELYLVGDFAQESGAFQPCKPELLEVSNNEKTAQ